MLNLSFLFVFIEKFRPQSPYSSNPKIDRIRSKTWGSEISWSRNLVAHCPHVRRHVPKNRRMAPKNRFPAGLLSVSDRSQAGAWRILTKWRVHSQKMAFKSHIMGRTWEKMENTCLAMMFWTGSGISLCLMNCCLFRQVVSRTCYTIPRRFPRRLQIVSAIEQTCLPIPKLNSLFCWCNVVQTGLNYLKVFTAGVLQDFAGENSGFLIDFCMWG